MRMAFHVDSATTPQVRTLSAALSRIGRNGTLQVSCDGPELWSATTPKLTEDEWQVVIREFFQ